MSTTFQPIKTGLINTLQERLITRCIRKNLSTADIAGQLILQRDVARKLANYPEFFGRSVFKKSVMVTANYGGSSQTSRSDVYEQLEALDSGILKDFTKEEQTMVTNFVYDSMSFAVPCSFDYLEYARKLFSYVSRKKDGIFFVNPISGMPVLLRKEHEKREEMVFKVNGKNKRTVLITRTDECNHTKTASSAVPGLIHSIDAGILMNIKGKIGDVPMSYIHDSVGASPNDMAIIRKAVNECLLEIFHSDALQNVVDQLLEGLDNVPDELRQVPRVNDWDASEAVEQILSSGYAFS